MKDPYKWNRSTMAVVSQTLRVFGVCMMLVFLYFAFQSESKADYESDLARAAEDYREREEQRQQEYEIEMERFEMQVEIDRLREERDNAREDAGTY